MNLKLFFSIFLLSASFLLYAMGKPALLKEHRMLETAVLWAGDSPEKLSADYLILTGKVVSTDSAAAWQGLVLANREDFTGTGRLNGWKVTEKQVAPFFLDTEKGKRLKVKLQKIPHRGKEIRVIPLEERTEKNRHIRLRGLAKNSRLTLVGKYDEKAQLFRATYSYAGTLTDYRILLEKGAKVLNQLAIALALPGLLLLGWHLARRKKNRTKSVS